MAPALAAMIVAAMMAPSCVSDEDGDDDEKDAPHTYCEVPLASLPAGTPAWCAKFGDADCDGRLRLDCGGDDDNDAPKRQSGDDDCHCTDPWCWFPWADQCPIPELQVTNP